jgi:hypothetical protein
MYEPVQKCTHCGANLTLDDLRGTNCRYCGTVLPHHAQAAQHAQVAGMVMNQMLAQQAQVQAQWRGAFGVGAPPGPPGAPMMPPPYGAPGSPYAPPMAMAEAHRAAATGIARTVTIVVVISVVGALMIAGALVVLVVLA